MRIFLKTSCCGYTLKTGTLKIGSLSLMSSVVVVGLTILDLELPLLLNSGTYKSPTHSGDSEYTWISNTNDQQHHFIPAFDEDIHDGNSGNNEDSFDHLWLHSRSLNVIIGKIVWYSLRIILSAIMLNGAIKGKMILLLPWIAYESLGIIIGVLFVGSFMILVCLGWSDEGSFSYIMITAALIALAVLALHSYLLLVVISYYQELRLESLESRNELHLTPDPGNVLPNVLEA